MMADDELLTLVQFIDYLRLLSQQHGSQQDLAQHIGISSAYLCDVLHGRRSPGFALLDGVGFEKVTIYRRKQQCQK